MTRRVYLKKQVRVVYNENAFIPLSVVNNNNNNNNLLTNIAGGSCQRRLQQVKVKIYKYASVKKCVLRFALKVESLEDSRTLAGREFHTAGSA